MGRNTQILHPMTVYVHEDAINMRYSPSTHYGYTCSKITHQILLLCVCTERAWCICEAISSKLVHANISDGPAIFPMLLKIPHDRDSPPQSRITSSTICD